MIKRLEFYKTYEHSKERMWFVDLPAYTEAGGDPMMLAMVNGADTWLDEISKGKDRITLNVSDEPFDGADHITMFCLDQDDIGAAYVAGFFEGKKCWHGLWLCPVTSFVFGKFPEVIFYKRVNEEYEKLFQQ